MRKILALVLALLMACSAFADTADDDTCIEVVMANAISVLGTGFLELSTEKPIYNSKLYTSTTGAYFYFDSRYVLFTGRDSDGILRQLAYKDVDQVSMSKCITLLCGKWDQLAKSGGKYPPFMIISLEGDKYVVDSASDAAIVKRSFELSMGTGDTKLLTTAKDANVRKGAGVKYDRIGFVPAGSVIVVLGVEKDQIGQEFYKIEFNGGYGYVVKKVVDGK